MRQLKRRVTVCLIAMMAAGSVSTLAFADSTEGSRSYGPALTLTGPEADLASKIHSGTNLQIDVPEGGNLAGTLVARGKYNVMLIDGTKGTIGKDDGKAEIRLRSSSIRSIWTVLSSKIITIWIKIIQEHSR